MFFKKVFKIVFLFIKDDQSPSNFTNQTMSRPASTHNLINSLNGMMEYSHVLNSINSSNHDACSIEEEKIRIQRQIEELKRRLNELDGEKKPVQGLQNPMNTNTLIQIQSQQMKMVQQVSTGKSEAEFYVKSENSDENSQKAGIKIEQAKSANSSKKKSQQKINQMDGFAKTIQQQMSDNKLNKQQHQQVLQSQTSTDQQQQQQQQPTTIISVPSVANSNAIITAPVQDFGQIQNAALTQ